MEERLPASLLVGCVETGGVVGDLGDRIAFVPGNDDPPIEILLREIVEMRLGGRTRADANRIDLTLLDGRSLTLVVVGRDRVVAAIHRAQGWEHAAAPPDV